MKVKTKTIQQRVMFKASPRQVYDLLMDSRKHQSLSGEKAVISRTVPGRFTAWNGHITGFNLFVKPGAKIVQAWRATGWWPEHYSIAIFDIQKAKGGCVLRFTQIGVPPHRYSGHYRGWIEAYWTPMKEVLARGRISEKTRGRVVASREGRIKTQHFRRKISNEA
jgi:activator of HSP90 ATPase